MKTQIKTKEFIKIIDPLTDGVNYGDQKIIVQLDEIKNFVEQPKQMKIFEPSTDTKEQLLKNLALYIINSTEQKFISVDLNNPNVFENGVFECIKSIYRKESNILLSLTEDGDNSLLIKRHKLIDIKNDVTVQNKNPEKAQDIELGKLSSIFLQTKVISNEEKAQKDKVTEKDRFFWKEDSPDLYANQNFLLEKVTEILKGNKYGKESTAENDFFNLIKKANNSIVQSDEFKLSLLNLNDSFLDKVIIHSKYPTIFSIDFSQPMFLKKIQDDIDNKRFVLLDELFKINNTQGYNRNQYAHKESLAKIDFKKLINQENVVEHLMDKYHSSSSRYDKEFSLPGCYELFEPKYKEDNTIIKKYISQITSKTMNNDYYINSDELFKIPLQKFNDESILAPVLNHIRMDEFKNLLNKNNVTNTLLSNKDFVLKNAHSMRAYKISDIVHNFIQKDQIDKQFVLDIMERKQDFYEQIKNNNLFSKFAGDLDVIMLAAQSGTKLYNIPTKVMSKHFLNKDSHDKELFKVEFLIEHGLNGKCGRYVFDDINEIAAFNQKYDKLEYSFFQKNDWSKENKARDKLLGKMKSLDDVNELLDNIDNLHLNYYFNTKSFYNALHPELKNNIPLVKRLTSFDNINYQDVSESLQYNQEMALFFIQLKPKTISLVPKEFFNDINFSLEFAKIMDSGNIDLKNEVPLFINKFFENQNVSENFYQHLKSYIFYNSIKETVPDIEDNNKPAAKKMKI
jgi:hypothetical protein